MIRVLIADDEPMVRTGIRSILATDPEIEVVGDAAGGSEAVAQAHRHRPDVALLDIRMPDGDGLTAAQRIRATLPDTAVIILTTFGEDEYIARALDHGAAGFLLKALDPRDLIAGVHAVANGAACLSPLVARRVITELRKAAPSRGHAARARVAALAPRERDVLALLGAGLSNADIARRLYLVEGTVKSYVSAVLARLEVRNRVQAAIIAVEAGLVDDQPTGSRPGHPV
jgi:DNA-binding NarL/FixJ family response regulator